MLANVLLFICLIALLILFLTVFISNPKKSVNRFLAFFLASGFLWILCNLLANSLKSDELILLFSRLSIVGATLLPLSFVLFVFSYIDEKITTKKVLAFSFVPFLILLTTPTSLNVKSATSTSFESGIIYPFLTIILLGYFGYGVYKLAIFRRNAKSVQKAQLNYFFLGFILTMIPAVIANAILPVFGYGEAAIYGPVSVIFISVFMALAIVRHKLLDIRLIVVRSLGYVLSIGIFVVTFALLSSLFVQNFFKGNTGSNWAILLNTVIFVAAVLTYPTLKAYFDKVSNKYFFRDAYDPQEFLDQLNKSIVSNIEIGILLRHTTAIIEENLKSSFVQIVVPRTENTAERIAGTKEVKYSDHEINYMRGRLVGLGKKLVIEEDLGPEEDELEKILTRHDISLLVHLSATSYGQDQTIAFMIFGNKKSGNVYSKADLKIIEIIADELVIAIQNALRFEEIQEFNVTLQNKVNSATNKLRRTNEKLKTLDETKDEFISMASHQLRTPLTSVKGYLSMVLEGDAGNVNPEQRKLLDQAFVSSQRMVYLIADLLNVSRLRTGKFVIDAHPSNLADLVDGEVSQLKEQAKSKDIDLSYEKPDEFADLLLDETKTRQVVMNFVDNALYYTPAGGKIDVSVSSDKNHVYFMVKDNGLGVPKDEQKHLFTKFYRAKNARNIRPDGTGLGLFMAKKVVTAQGGNILFDSVEGKGSTFGFSFSKKHLAIPEVTPVLEEK